MKTINVTFEDGEFEVLKSEKGYLTWRKFILKLIENTKGQKKVRGVWPVIPKPIVDEVDIIIKNFPELYVNREQFIESAIRKEIKNLRKIENMYGGKERKEMSV